MVGLTAAPAVGSLRLGIGNDPGVVLTGEVALVVAEVADVRDLAEIKPLGELVGKKERRVGDLVFVLTAGARDVEIVGLAQSGDRVVGVVENVDPAAGLFRIDRKAVTLFARGRVETQQLGSQCEFSLGRNLILERGIERVASDLMKLDVVLAVLHRTRYAHRKLTVFRGRVVAIELKPVHRTIGPVEIKSVFKG